MIWNEITHRFNYFKIKIVILSVLALVQWDFFIVSDTKIIYNNYIFIKIYYLLSDNFHFKNVWTGIIINNYFYIYTVFLLKKKKYNLQGTEFFYNWNFLKKQFLLLENNPFSRNSNFHVCRFKCWFQNPNIHITQNVIFKFFFWYKPVHTYFYKTEYVNAYLIIYIKLLNKNDFWIFFQIKNNFYFILKKNCINDFIDTLKYNSDLYIYYKNSQDYFLAKSYYIFFAHSNRIYCNWNLMRELKKWKIKRYVATNFW